MIECFQILCVLRIGGRKMSLDTVPIKLQKRTTDGIYTMTIPKKFAEELNLENGDRLSVKVEPKKNRLIVTTQGEK